MEKPLEKPLIPMVEMWKTIDNDGSLVKKPLKNHWPQWYLDENHWHSIVPKNLPSPWSNRLAQNLIKWGIENSSSFQSVSLQAVVEGRWEERVILMWIVKSVSSANRDLWLDLIWEEKCAKLMWTLWSLCAPRTTTSLWVAAFSKCSSS